jgi:protein-L-isoaspartate(D-aspartate) O-methyltransferase
MSWATDLLRGDGARADQPRDVLLERLRRDPRISADAVEAIARVGREIFVPEQHRELAYEDVALEIGPVATISAPSMVAEMLTALDLRAGLSVLEIGGGSGYAAATIAAYRDHVVSIEVQPELAEQARRNLDRAGLSDLVRTMTADGRWGWAQLAPYDRILVSAAVDAVPQAWLDQLAPGGILVYPESGHGEDLLVRLTRGDDEGLTREIMGRCRFVRMQL